MGKLQIIYTPEANYFKFDDLVYPSWRNPRDPAVQTLRKNYEKLKNSFPNLPLKTGVITYDDLFKQESKNMFKKIENPTTTYMPLDILKQILELKDKDFTDPLVREYASRRIELLLNHHSVSSDEGLMFGKGLMFAVIAPQIEQTKGFLKKTLEKIKESGEQLTKGGKKIIKTFQEGIRKCKKISDFTIVEKAYKEVLEKFKANKVSKDFPLYFLPPCLCLPALFSISLEEKIESSLSPELEKYLKLGCEASGHKEIPDDIKKYFENLERDRFGETTRINSLDELLQQLPEPQTLITDLYIVNLFPQLEKIEFEANEFKFEQAS